MNPIPDINIGEEIRRRFDLSRLTQKEFGSRIGMPQSNIYRIFNSDSIDTKRLVAVSQALNFNFFRLYCAKDVPVVHTEGNYSPASDSGDVSVVVGDAVLTERVSSLEKHLSEKERVIKTQEETIKILKRMLDLNSPQKNGTDSGQVN